MNGMKILVTGATGQLGHDVCKELANRNIAYIGTSSKDFDLTHKEQVWNFIQGYKPTAVIHCAGYTAVDKAQEEPIKCFEVNEKGTQYIAESCRDLDIGMIYISTDYVFEGRGEQPYGVDDIPNPQNIYGKSKLAGEKSVKFFLEKYFIVRISWVFGENGNNFIKTMLKIGKDKESVNVVSDQIGSPTYTRDLAPLLCDMIMTDKYGIYHATNEGFCSWAELAEEIFKVAGYETKVEHIKTEEYPTKVDRPMNSRLSKKHLKEKGFVCLPHWQHATKRYVNILQNK